MPDTVTLSSRQPRVELPVRPSAFETGADVLVLSVIEVTNPRMRPVELGVWVARGTGEREPIGYVALFPPDRPARFALRVPASAGSLMAGGPLDLRLVIELAPDSTDAKLGERRVTLGEPTWQRSN